MIRVTRSANEYLRHVRDAKGIESTAGARFVRSSGRIGVTFATAPAPGDQVVGAEDLQLYIPDELAAALASSIIDISSEDGNPRLVLRPQ